MGTSGIIALGAVTAALIAAVFSFLNLVIAKEQKVSEFRQQWIDALRSDIAQYIAGIRYLAQSHMHWVDGGRKTDWHEHWKALQIPYDNAARAFSSIFLRINPDDSDVKLKSQNTAFLAKLEAVRDFVRDAKYNEATTAVDDLNELAQPILKCEWKRVKWVSDFTGGQEMRLQYFYLRA